MDLQSLLSGALIGVVVEQVVMYLINKGQVEKAVEQAKKVIPERYEALIAKLLDEVSAELKDKEEDE